jgi:hypothetical protein
LGTTVLDHQCVSGVRLVNVLWLTGFGLTSTSTEDVERIRESFAHSSQESVGKCSRELQIPSSPPLHMHARFKLWRLSGSVIVWYAVHAFATDILETLDEDNGFLERVVFTDEAVRDSRHNVTV